ncbi:MAG: putative F420-dependent oxidoreductase [Candidatus Poriferisodalaceae bacterium]|jgi:probable F420-dependent oxidoreductase
MQIDTFLGPNLDKAADAAATAEEAGYDAMWTAETSHDPFFPLALAAPGTSKITLGTSIAVAFSRNPMLLANIGYDLQSLSKGRFVMGLGSQIKPHITKRFSMEWSKPAARMREMVLAMHAIWDCWQDGTKLDFRGDFYTHTLMTPMFSPGPNPHGKPPVLLAGVGPLMTQVAGEVCDGFFCHPFTTAEFLADVTIPALNAGRAKSGRSADGFEVCLPAFVVTGSTEEDMAANALAVRKQISFYGSTPEYRTVLDHHGWGDMQTELNSLSKKGEWDTMATLIDDDVLGAFAVVGEPDTIAAGLQSRYGQSVDRLSFNTMGANDDDLYAPIIAELKA